MYVPIVSKVSQQVTLFMNVGLRKYILVSLQKKLIGNKSNTFLKSLKVLLYAPTLL